MNNQMTIQENYNTQLEMTLEGIQKIEVQKNKKRKKLVFQPYCNRQVMSILDIEMYIPENHVARLVDEMVESIPDEVLYTHYVGGGRAPYHPKMLLKVILYAYTQNVYSSRKMAQMVKENLPMMWLAGLQTPDHRTINDFRSVRMSNMMDSVFEQFVLQLVEQGFIDLDHIFVDGTKIEANANKYTFVWRKSVEKYDQKLRAKIQSFLQEAHQIALEELKEEQLEEELEKSSAQLSERIEALEKDYKQEEDKERKKELRSKKSQLTKQLKTIQTDYLPRLRKYKVQKQILGERNSYSKTDHEATFMRMKEDHMKNGQLKAGYNVQLATQHQFIVGFEIYQNPGDTRCFQPFMEKLLESIPKEKKLKYVIADAGYASEENYLYAIGEEKEPRFELLAPYQTYLKEQSKKFKKDLSKVQNWKYIEEDDCFICPNNRKVVFKYYQKRKNASGYIQDLKVYECEDCTDCPLKNGCTKAKGNRRVYWNTIYEEMKAKAKAALGDEQKAALYAKRKVDVESVFGNIKGNLRFTRFLLRGLHKVRTEFGIVAMAHNILKWAANSQTNFKNKETERMEKLIVFSIRSVFMDFLDKPFSLFRKTGSMAQLDE
ncbi:IS1182 family transposase [Ureibacillus sp. FSL W7-1570]|uniref:IS1182 family transposase n=2 Tax=unclassified Ureibacillus TaxID=2638520 RepID=UPI00315A59ED